MAEKWARNRIEMAGRPSKDQLRERAIETILEEVAAGLSLTEVCQTKVEGVTPAQFRAWVRTGSPELKQRWKEARADHAHTLFDQLIYLTAELAHGRYDKVLKRRVAWDKDSNAEVTALRVAIDGLKHATSRLLPSDYGEQKATTPAMSVTFMTSLPLGPGSTPENAIDTTFRVVGTIPQVEDKSDGG